MTPYPSCSCSAPSVRLIGSVAYCHDCAEALLEPIRARVLTDESGVGYGRQSGRLRDDYGPRFAELTCSICAATWVGIIGEPCAYCETWLAAAIEDRRQHLLRPSLPDRDDRRHDRAVDAWTRALAEAVRAEIITIDEARAAVARREVRHVA